MVVLEGEDIYLYIYRTLLSSIVASAVLCSSERIEIRS